MNKAKRVIYSRHFLFLIFSFSIEAKEFRSKENVNKADFSNGTEISVTPKEDILINSKLEVDAHSNVSDSDEDFRSNVSESLNSLDDQVAILGNSFYDKDDVTRYTNYTNDNETLNRVFYSEYTNESMKIDDEHEEKVKIKNNTIININVPDDKANKKSREKKERRKLEKNSKEEKKKRKNKKHKSKKEENKISEDSGKEIKPKADSRIRLPTSVAPVHYVLRLHPRLDASFLVTGSVEIEIEAREATPRIKLHASHIQIDKASVQVSLLKAHRKIPIKHIKFNSRREFLTIKLSRKLKPGRIYVVSMKFKYHLSEEAKGFYKIEYVNSEGKISWLAATQFWPSDARRAFPCFDEPEMKATFDVHLARSEDMQSLTSMPLVRFYKKKEEPEWIWDQFATSPNMSTYLLAFVVTQFTSSTNEKAAGLGNHLKVWSRKSMANKTALALDVGNSSILFFEKYFEMNFPLPKMDMIALPKMAFNGMENWGLITYKESSLLIDGATSSAEAKLAVSTLVAHEVAHQWFGNLVTFEWWNDLWLNEGFATYMSFLAVDHAKPWWNIMDQFVSTRLQQVMAIDALPSSHAVSFPVKDPSSINEVFDSIPYNKGASLIRMMKHFLSEATFKKGLQNYLRNFKYKNTRQDDLWHSMTKAAQKDKSLPAGISVKGIMDTWTLQKGYPYLQVERYNNGTAFLTQKRFLLGKLSSKRRNEMKSKWWIPITFTTQERPSFRHTRAQTWLRQEDDSLQVTGLPPQDEWVVFNLQQTGYYRVNYDERTWLLLIDELERNHEIIFVTNRAQLIDDSLNLARAGLLPYDIALQLLSYLEHEKSYVPWSAGLRNLEFIKDMVQTSKDYGSFKNFVFDLLSPLITGVEEGQASEDSLQERLLRSEAFSWLCQMNHKMCLKEAQKIIENLNNNDQRMDVMVSDPVLCSAIRNGNEETWEKLFDIFKASKSEDNKLKYLKALGCSTHVWLINRYLDLMIEPSSGILRQDGYQLYEAASQTPIGTYVAWDAFRTSWRIMSNFSDFSYFVAPGIIETISKSFNTHHQLKELHLFKEQIKSESSKSPVLPALNSAIAKVEANVKWMNKNLETIVRWAKERASAENNKP